ncbi:hypothetical protein D0T53_12570 [Dysgonomonas sp. 216]|nr:hypothetical protein [Dysgonomonas sp. 216]
MNFAIMSINPINSSFFILIIQVRITFVLKAYFYFYISLPLAVGTNVTNICWRLLVFIKISSIHGIRPYHQLNDKPTEHFPQTYLSIYKRITIRSFFSKLKLFAKRQLKKSGLIFNGQNTQVAKALKIKSCQICQVFRLYAILYVVSRV